MNKNKNQHRVFRNLQPLPKGKKGILLAEETLKMIIALIGIGVLIYLLVSIYFNSTLNQKKQQAEAVLEEIIAIVNNVQMQTGAVLNPTPFGWWVFGFVGTEEKPNSCFGENCLCICGKSLPLFSQQKKCDEKGVCKTINNLEDFENFKIKSGIFSIEVIKDENKIIISGK